MMSILEGMVAMGLVVVVLSLLVWSLLVVRLEAAFSEETLSTEVKALVSRDTGILSFIMWLSAGTSIIFLMSPYNLATGESISWFLLNVGVGSACIMVGAMLYMFHIAWAEKINRRGSVEILPETSPGISVGSEEKIENPAYAYYKEREEELLRDHEGKYVYVHPIGINGQQMVAKIGDNLAVLLELAGRHGYPQNKTLVRRIEKYPTVAYMS